MSKVCRNENRWINLVFEGRNKEYGAYQLRKDDVKTTSKAFFFGLVFVTTLFCIGLILSSFGEKPIEKQTTEDSPQLKIVTFKSELKKIPEKKATSVKKPQLNSEVKVSTKFHPIVSIVSEVVDQTPVKSSTNGTDSNLTIDIANTGSLTDNSGATNMGEVEMVANKEPFSTGALDQLPEFPGGIAKFYSYVGSNFEKPEIDFIQNIRIEVSFVIEIDGAITDIKVLRNPGYGLEKEAIRVLKSLKTKWKPGIIEGKAVRTSYLLPIVVSLN